MTAFFTIFSVKSREWITLPDIQSYLALFPLPPYREWFARLILGMQFAYMEEKTRQDAERNRFRNRRFK